jgi:hypothetical protein
VVPPDPDTTQLVAMLTQELTALKAMVVQPDLR